MLRGQASDSARPVRKKAARSTPVATASQSISFTGPANQPYTATPLGLSASASSGLTVSFAILSGPATIQDNQLTLTGPGTVTVQATQAGDASFAAATPVTQSFTVTPDFASWQLANFPTQLNNPAVSGPTAVTGQDGLSNLLNYALGLTVTHTGISGLPALSTSDSNWFYGFSTPTAVQDVTLAVEVSTDLFNWTTAGVTLTKTGSDGTTDTWQATFPRGSGRNIFFRLRATQP